MKITRLDLAAFGPFTNLSLDFASASPGLHVVYGPNEAGKSSTLRALKAWLFGFPERTSDNFLHANDQLLVGGTLLAEDGRELSFLRRKKRKADLLDREGNPLPAEALAAFMPIHDQALFDSLYGISHEALVRGGEDILAQHGDVGQALFAAGAGLSSLRGVLNELEAEAEGLYKVRGSRQEINIALARLQELQKEERQASLSGRDWQELHTALREALARQEEIEGLQAQKKQERLRLERLRHSLPQLALRRNLLDRLAGLGPVLLLPEDFGKRRQELEKQRHSHGEKVAVAEKKLQALREKLAAIHLPRQLIEFEERIEDLHQRLGGYQKARADRPEREGMRIGCKREAAEFLRQVRPDLPLERAEELRPFLGRRRMLTELATTLESLRQGRGQTERVLARTRAECKRLAGELGLLPAARDPLPLEKAVRLARKRGPLDLLLAEKEKLCAGKEEECEQEAARLPLWQGGFRALLLLPLPLEATLLAQEHLFAVLEEEEKAVLHKQEQASEQLAAVLADLARFSSSGPLPSEEELARLRSLRDRGWSLLKRQWLAGEELGEEGRAYHPNLPLADAFEKNMGEADETADRLRREAREVHAFTALEAERQRLAALLLAFEQKEAGLAQRRSALRAEWEGLWIPCGFAPLPPKEMLAWLGRVEKLRFRAEELSRLEAERQALREERRQLREALLSALTGPDAPPVQATCELEPLLLHGEQILHALGEAAIRRQRLLDALEARRNEEVLLESTLREQETALNQWREQWSQVSAGLAGQRELYPAEALDLLENLGLCLGKLKEANDFQKRIAGIDQDMARYEVTVAEVAEKIAPDLTGQAAEQVVVQLKARLNQARDDRTLLADCRRGIAETEEELLLLAGERESVEKQLQDLCRQAGCQHPAELEGAEELSRQYRELQARLQETETMLIRGAGGLDLDRLEEEARHCDDPDALPGQIAGLARELDEVLAPESRRLSELIGEKKTRLDQMDGSARAARAAEEAALAQARLKRLCDRYLKLKLAAHTLKGEIERYRAANQDPVIGLASRYFQAMTLGAYRGLRTDENERGEPILVGVRGENQRVEVAGGALPYVSRGGLKLQAAL